MKGYKATGILCIMGMAGILLTAGCGGAETVTEEKLSETGATVAGMQTDSAWTRHCIITRPIMDGTQAFFPG